MSMGFLTHGQLKPMKNIPGSKATIWRKENAQPPKFPRHCNFGPRFAGWFEPVIDKYKEAIALRHTEEEATVIAEQYLKDLLAKGDDANGPTGDEDEAEESNADAV
jgi:predicted DNA-binding transcriptional regulator AlpA